MPAQPVDATPSDINRFSKGGIYDASETGEAFREPANRHVEPLEGGTVVAYDRACLRQGPCVHSAVLPEKNGLVRLYTSGSRQGRAAFKSTSSKDFGI